MGIIRIDEAALEDYVCFLNHVQRIVLKEDVVFAPSLSRVVQRKVKITLKELVCISILQELLCILDILAKFVS